MTDRECIHVVKLDSLSVGRLDLCEDIHISFIMVIVSFKWASDLSGKALQRGPTRAFTFCSPGMTRIIEGMC